MSIPILITKITIQFHLFPYHINNTSVVTQNTIDCFFHSTDQRPRKCFHQMLSSNDYSTRIHLHNYHQCCFFTKTSNFSLYLVFIIYEFYFIFKWHFWNYYLHLYSNGLYLIIGQLIYCVKQVVTLYFLFISNFNFMKNNDNYLFFIDFKDLILYYYFN